MKIELNQPYKSIESLVTEELPDFAVLIGRNGAGKSQLLSGLKEGAARIPGVSLDEIELFDMVSFRPPNANQANRHSNQFAQSTSDVYLLSPPGAQSPIETAATIFEQCVDEIRGESEDQVRIEFERNLRDEIRQLPDFTVFAENNRETPYKEALFVQVLAPLLPVENERQRRRSSERPKNQFYGNQAALISAAMKLNGKLPHELTHDDIMQAAHYEGDTISNSISEVFTTYKVDQYTWAHKRIESELVGFEELIAEYREKYPPPWETLREILSSMRDAAGEDGLFDFEYSDPDDFNLHMGNYESFSFKSEMTNRTSGAQYELDSLSSGEKILMALCLVSFNQYLGRRRPKLLLLDELDAVLHPSMISALVGTLKSQFVSKGAKVLMASHSSMTVATLDEAEIFRVSRAGGHVEVSRTTKSEAISELTEGLATVDMGLKIAAYEGKSVTLLTEGHNAKHLQKWVEVTGLSENVHVFQGLESHSNDNALLAYGRLLGRVGTNTHFVIVWDCDAAGKAEAFRKELPNAKNVTPFAFRNRPDNSIAGRGIENNYEETLIEPYATRNVDFDGRLKGYEFRKEDKASFANFIQSLDTPEHFVHFQDLHDIVSRILSAAGKLNSQTSSVH